MHWLDYGMRRRTDRQPPASKRQGGWLSLLRTSPVCVSNHDLWTVKKAQIDIWTTLAKAGDLTEVLNPTSWRLDIGSVPLSTASSSDAHGLRATLEPGARRHEVEPPRRHHDADAIVARPPTAVATSDEAHGRMRHRSSSGLQMARRRPRSSGTRPQRQADAMAVIFPDRKEIRRSPAPRTGSCHLERLWSAPDIGRIIDTPKKLPSVREEDRSTSTDRSSATASEVIPMKSNQGTWIKGRQRSERAMTQGLRRAMFLDHVVPATASGRSGEVMAAALAQ